MTLYITEISKYIIAILAVLYAVTGFITLKFRSERKRRPFYVIQTIFLFAIEGFCFLQIVARTGNLKLLFYGIALTFILATMLLLFGAFFPDGNRLIINNAAFLLMTSIITLVRIDEDKAIRQLIIAAASVAVMFVVCEIVYKFPSLTNFTWLYGFGGAALLGIVLVLGSMTHGSYLSIRILGITFQPSEFVKIVFIFFLACELCRQSGVFEVGTSFLVAVLYIMILVISRDLGASAIIFVICLCMVFLATRKPAYLLGGVIVGMLGAMAASALFTHVQVRIQAWIDPWSTIEKEGYQLTQSLFGISAGGWFGLGLFKGNPQTIPFVEDDFIFSAIAEEFGIIYAVSMILIILSMFLMMLLESSRLRDNWSKLVDGGIAVSLIFQTFLTVGGGTKFIPLTGVTLPLVSYGGSSMMATMICIGVFEATCLIRADEHYEAVQQYKQRMRLEK